MNNREFAMKDQNFGKACTMAAGVLFPGEDNKAMEFSNKIRTPRQASKFRRGTGIVWKTLNNMM
jgi:hypothetical protein